MTLNTAILFYTFLSILVTSEANSIKWKKRKEECKMQMTFVFQQHVMGNLKECFILCENTTDCETVSWYVNGTCLFSDINTVDDVRDSYIKWELAPNWKTYSRALYPVARVFDPDPTSTFMTFARATSVCADQGSGIASPAHLLEAGHIGLNKDWCSWLSNGNVGYVEQISDSSDDSEEENGPTVVYCNTTNSPAWCKLS